MVRFWPSPGISNCIFRQVQHLPGPPRILGLTEISRFSATSPELAGWFSETWSLQRPARTFEAVWTPLSLPSKFRFPARETLVRRDPVRTRCWRGHSTGKLARRRVGVDLNGGSDQVRRRNASENPRAMLAILAAASNFSY